MASRFVRVRVQCFASGYEARAEHSDIAVNGHESETDAVRALALALSFKPGRFTTHFHGNAGDGVAADWSIEEIR